MARILVPQYQFVRSARFCWEIWESLTRDLAASTCFPTDVPPHRSTKFWNHELQAMTSYASRWLRRRLGFDCSKRLDRIKGLRVYAQRNWHRVKQGGTLNPLDLHGSASAGTREITLRYIGDLHSMQMTLWHELVHLIGASIYRVDFDTAKQCYVIKSVKMGYELESTRAFMLFSEALTEMMALELAAGYYHTRSFSYPVGYASMLLLLDRLIRQAATTRCQSALDIRDRLYAGYIAGNHRVLKQVFDQRTLTLLASLRQLPKTALDLTAELKTFSLEAVAYDQQAYTWMVEGKPYQLSSGIWIRYIED